jgi:hypothetical protein
VFLDENVHSTVIVDVIANVFVLQFFAILACTLFAHEEIFDVLAQGAVALGIEIDDMDVRALTGD